MTLEYLSDPVAALVMRLSAADSLVRTLGNCEDVTAPWITSLAVPIEQRIRPVIVFKGAGIGDGSGQRAQAHYEGIRIDCIAYAARDFEASALSKLAAQDILNSRNRTVNLTYGGIQYRTRFITVIQTGGPVPIRDEHTDWTATMTTWSINANSAKLTPAGA